MEFIVKDNIREFTRHLKGIQRNQIPYVTSRALNDTAVDAQTSVQKRAQHVFSNRKTWWKKQQPMGIKVKFSRKNDLTAQVFTKAYFAKLQEDGGTKTPHRSGKLLVPTERVPKKYHKSTGAREIIRDRKNIFADERGVFRRKGKRHLELMWSKASSAKVRPAFAFADTISKVVTRRFKKHFNHWVEKALRSAKMPSR